MAQSVLTELDRKVKRSRDGVEVTRKFSLWPYENYPQVTQRILGYIYYSNGQFGRVMPLADPIEANCFAESVSVDGVGAFTHANNTKLNFTQEYQLLNANLYTEADITVQYRSNTFTSTQWASNNEGILLGLSFTFSGQQLTLPSEFYTWANSPSVNIGQSGTNAVKTIPKCGMQVARYYCINRPINAITQLLGKINATDILWQDVLFPAGTLRFDSADIKEKTTYNDVKYYEITYKMEVQTIWEEYATSAETVDATGVITVPSSTAYGYVGWNRVYRPDRGFWDELKTCNGGKKPYVLDSVVTQTINGATVTGFNLLTDPGAK